MIGLVFVTHGSLATEFQLAVEHVVGPQEDLEAICIGPDDDMEQRRIDILEAVAAVNTGSGVIIVTDMFGGTPSNLAISIMEPGLIEVMAGMNLPMVIKMVGLRATGDMDDVLEKSVESGRRYINVASQVLAGQ